MSTTLAFDVYGTLIDTHDIVSKVQEVTEKDAEEFSRTWRDKQLEYSFRRGLMRKYENFAICTRDALKYTCAYHKISLTAEQTEILLEAYRTLPTYSDVKEGLTLLRSAGFRLYAFSNGSAMAVETLLATAGIRDLFLGVVSVDALKTFKPDPEVYQHFLKESGAGRENAWLISSNPFDVIGARAAGMHAAWVQRDGSAIFDPWGIEPTITVSSLSELSERISALKN